MSLKLIPVEHFAEGSGNNGGSTSKKQKQFNPGNQIKKNVEHKGGSPLKLICLRLVHFINRGSKFTYEQIDELIVALHHGILSLRKQKQEMLRKKRNK